MNNKITSTIAGASIVITIITLAGRGLGFVREIIFAAFFGLSQEFEIYLVATVLASVINIVLIVLGQNYFIPNYFKASEKTDKSFFLNQSLLLFLSLSLIVAFILFIFSERIIDFYVNVDSESAKSTAITIFNLFLPTIPLTALISILFAFLQSEKNFTAPVFSNLFTNVFLIGAVPLLSTKMGILVIPAFYLAGTAFQLFFLYIVVKKKTNIHLTFFHLKSGLAKTLGSFLVFAVLIEIIGQMFVIVDRYFLDAVQKGGIAALNYSATLYQLPIVILPFAVSTVLFPSFSELIQRKETSEIENKLNKSISVLIFLTMPIAFIFFFWGEFLVRILFERGSFSSFDSIITANTLKIYSISLVFYAIYSVLNKFFFSSSLLKELLFIICGGLLIKISLNVLFVKSLFQNGLALSTSLSFIYFCILCLIFVRKIKITAFNIFCKNFLYYSLNCGVGIIIVYIIVNKLNIGYKTFLSNVFAILIFFIIFLFNSYLVRDKSFSLVINSLKDIKTGLFKEKLI